MATGNVKDLWTRERKGPDGRPVLDARNRPTREHTARWGRGKRWLATWEENGRRISQAFEFREAAEDKVGRVRTESVDGTHITRDKADVPLSAMWSVWIASKADRANSTVAGYEAAWKLIEPRWGHRPCAIITNTDVAAWIPTLTTTKGAGIDQKKNQLTRPLGAASKRKVGIVMKALLDVAVDQKVIHRNPISSKSIPQQEESTRRYLTVSEVDQLLTRASADDARSRRFIEVLLFSGPRPGEVEAMNVADLDRVRRRIRIHITKSRRARDVPVGSVLVDALVEDADGRGGDAPLLRAPRGGRWTESARDRLWERIGIDGVTMYELRHTCASMAIAAGADVKTIQSMLGHQSAKETLDIYGHLWADRLDSITDAVQDWMSGQRTNAQNEQGANETS